MLDTMVARCAGIVSWSLGGSLRDGAAAGDDPSCDAEGRRPDAIFLSHVFPRAKLHWMMRSRLFHHRLPQKSELIENESKECRQ
jgi:hypothetical protein